MPETRVLIGINPEDILAPRFTHYWSSCKGLVNAPNEAAVYFDHDVAKSRTRRLRNNGHRAFIVSETAAPWLFPLNKKSTQDTLEHES